MQLEDIQPNTDGAAENTRSMFVEEEFELEFHRQNSQIEDELAKHSLLSALRWCTNHRSKLQKLRSPFEFRMRMLEFVHCVVNEGPRAAMHYLHDNLREVEPEQVKELKHVLSRLTLGI